MTRRRQFSLEFRREAVALLKEPGVSASQVAKRLGISVSILCRWRRKFEAEEKAGFEPGGKVAADEEVRRLQRELDRVTQERDVLKKAVAFFAKESK
jgi:transposase